MDQERNPQWSPDPSAITESLPAGHTQPSGAHGAMVGPYKLQEVLGEGGFGIVWLAERRAPMVQRVALKVIKPGMDSRAIIARFEQERQALAILDHPNIAKVFDGGITETGLPYFVMEYVPGEPITSFCDRHGYTLRQRLQLFAPVCEAVQHAHHHGIIHRDLKPGNILVSSQGDVPTPKIIDFGIAKATSKAITEKTVFTETGQLIGTPEYMSPEQASMGPSGIDARTDVYSLGVVLYELLTGALPFDPAELRSKGYAEIQRILQDVEPPTPSRRITMAGSPSAEMYLKTRQAAPAAVIRELRHELEWIPLKAMRKERAARYSTAAELADDISKFLNGEALAAGPRSDWYAIMKIIQRRRARALALAGSFVLPLIVSCVLGVVLARLNRANEGLRMSAMRYVIASARASLQLGDHALAEEMIDGGLQSLYQGRFRYSMLDLAQAELVLAASLIEQNRLDEARPILTKATDRLRRHLDTHVETTPADLQYGVFVRGNLAQALHLEGRAMAKMGDTSAAERKLNEALELATSIGYHALLPGMRLDRALVVLASGDIPRAEALLEQWLSRHRSYPPQDRSLPSRDRLMKALAARIEIAKRVGDERLASQLGAELRSLDPHWEF